MATSVISGSILDPSGAAVAGARVVARLLPGAAFLSGGAEVLGQTETATDTTGAWALSLERQSNITPGGTYYEVTEFVRTGGRQRRTVWYISVPDTDAELLTCLITPPADNPTYETTLGTLNGTYVGRAGGTSGTVAPLVYFNVKDYGAVGDGVTDDATAIAAAITAASSAGGGTVYLPQGTYIVGATLVLASNITLTGAGMGATTIKLKNSVNVRVFNGSSLSDVVIRDLTIDGNSANNTGSACYGVFLSNPTRAVVSRVRVHHTAADNIYLNGTPVNCRIEGCVVSDTGASAFESIRADAGTLIKGCNVVGDIGQPIYVGADCAVNSCTVDATAGTAGSCVRIGGDRVKVLNCTLAANATAIAIKGIQVNECVISGNRTTGGTVGIHFGPPSGGVACTASRNTIADNVILSTATDGILLGVAASIDTGTDNVVTGNTVDTMTATSGTGACIETQLANTTITGNACSRSNHHGIYCGGAGSTVAGNDIRSNGLSGAGAKAGIKVTASNVVVSGNTVLDTGNASSSAVGVLVSDDNSVAAVGVLVVGNKITDTRAGGSKRQLYGIQQLLTSTVSATANDLSGNATAATDGTVTELYADLTGAQTVAGVKTFSSAPVVPATSFPNVRLRNLTDPYKRTGALYETYSRIYGGSNCALLATGLLSMVAIDLPLGVLVSTITFSSGSTALSLGSNQWFALFDSARAKLGVTNDDTSTAWAANTEKTLTLASPFTTTYAGIHYLGICVVATVVPSIMGMVVGGSGAFPARAPALAGLSTSGLTDPASCPSTAGALGAIAGVHYAWVA